MIPIISCVRIIAVVGLEYGCILRIDDGKSTLDVQISFTVNLLSSARHKSAYFLQGNHDQSAHLAIGARSVFTFQRFPCGKSGGSTPPSIDRSMGVVPFGMSVRCA